MKPIQKVKTNQNWREVRLGEVARIITGNTPSTKDPSNFGGPYPFITIPDVDQNHIYIKNTSRTISEKASEKMQNLLLPANAVFMSCIATIGKCGIVFIPSFTNQQINTAIPNESLNYKFLYYTFKNETHQLQSFAGVSVYDNVSKSKFEGLVIKIPPLPEQKAIAEVLSSLDDKIDLLHRQNKTLEDMAQTLFRKWFVDDADEGWEVGRLGDSLTISSSKRIFYKEYVEIGIPFYRSKEIIELSTNGTTKSELHITEERFSKLDSKFGSPKEGDVLLTSVGTLGVVYRVRKHDKFYFKDGNLTWFRNFHGLSSAIIYCWLNSSIGKEALSNITIGSTQTALTLSGLRNIELTVPPIEIQGKLDSELNSIFNKRNLNLEQVRTLRNLRETLLPKLMSGDIRVDS